VRSRSPWRATGCLLVVIALTLTGCYRLPPDRRAQADQLASEIRSLPGVAAVSSDLADRFAEGNVHLWLSVDVIDGINADQIATITTRYLDALRTVGYPGYQTELDIHHGWNRFAVDSGPQLLTNADQIIGQARDWAALRHEFPAATITLSAAISHPTSGAAERDRGHPVIGTIDMPDADYNAVSAATSTLGARFSHLATGTWTLGAGKTRAAVITASQRLPTPQELRVWNTLTADQRIPHAEAMTINAPATPPVWISEKIFSHDPAAALALAVGHLPVVATLPAPLLYTATDQLQGHRDYNNRTTAPVAVTIAGCTPRTYRPDPAEQNLINTYETCRG
jgi:hypothetical protein